MWSLGEYLDHVLVGGLFTLVDLVELVDGRLLVLGAYILMIFGPALAISKHISALGWLAFSSFSQRIILILLLSPQVAPFEISV